MIGVDYIMQSGRAEIRPSNEEISRLGVCFTFRFVERVKRERQRNENAFAEPNEVLLLDSGK